MMHDESRIPAPLGRGVVKQNIQCPPMDDLPNHERTTPKARVQK